MKTIHLTHTGQFAGLPFCNINKTKALNEGQIFMHVPYSNLKEFFARPEICKDCLKIWNDETED